MALHFISSSILKESDGIDEAEEVSVDTEETRKARIKAEQDSKKSLHQQLQERQALKDEEFEANRRKIFAPPPGLDEEDVEYFNDLQSTKDKMKSLRAIQEDQALEEFRHAAQDRVFSLAASASQDAGAHAANSSSGGAYTLSIPDKANKAPEMAAMTIVKKRRIGAEGGGGDKRVTMVADPHAAALAPPPPPAAAAAAAAAATATTAAAATAPAPSSALLGLAGYDSENDD